MSAYDIPKHLKVKAELRRIFQYLDIEAGGLAVVEGALVERLPMEPELLSQVMHLKPSSVR